ncbi:unnamed protein product [Kuraishia capsulata CBS 1993]|uniref:DNA-directed RNA polymerase III subunit RPC9 n=1 Tax=Kuraishia capsulata CBS 1993 TaxID=1382522 RepID=W6MKX2_9ASCO|nr:uncharacterized protein KUCA_T00002687001 [Kuraishia capsulata CBS 1993]CDK26713.1 unnamed protein product [Kuraishia capsulata CBS 1993]
MKIEVERDKFLSNLEVYHHLCGVQVKNSWLSDSKGTKRRKNTNLAQLESISRDLTSYLGKVGSCPSDHERLQKNYAWDSDSFVEALKRLNQYPLEKIEKLQILNFVPRTMVTLYSLIEECDQRFDQAQSEEILGIVNDCFPMEAVEGEDEEQQDITMD